MGTGRAAGGRVSATAFVTSTGTTAVSGGRIIGMVVVILVFLDGRAGGAGADGEATGHVGGRRGYGHLARAAVDWRADGHGGGNGAVGSVEAGLDEIFAFRLGDKWLEFGGGEGVDKTGFGDDEQQDLRAGQCGELIGLNRTVRRKGWTFMEDELPFS